MAMAVAMRTASSSATDIGSDMVVDTKVNEMQSSYLGRVTYGRWGEEGRKEQGLKWTFNLKVGERD